MRESRKQIYSPAVAAAAAERTTNGGGGREVESEEEEEVCEGRRIPSPRAIYNASGAVVGSGAPSQRLRVAVCMPGVGQVEAQKIRRTRRDVRAWIEVAVMSRPSWHVIPY